MENSFGIKILPEDSKKNKGSSDEANKETTEVKGDAAPVVEEVPDGPPPRVDENPFEYGHEPPPVGSQESVPTKGILSPAKKAFSYNLGKHVSFGNAVIKVFSEVPEVLPEPSTPAPVPTTSHADDVATDPLWSKVNAEGVSKAHAPRLSPPSAQASLGSPAVAGFNMNSVGLGSPMSSAQSTPRTGSPLGSPMNSSLGPSTLGPPQMMMNRNLMFSTPTAQIQEHDDGDEEDEDDDEDDDDE
jgi:hypothetical protein